MRTRCLFLLLALAACKTTPEPREAEPEAEPEPEAATGAVAVGARIDALGPTWVTWTPQVQRVLGEVTHVDKVVWDWRDQAGWVRFKPGKVADEQALKDAIQYGTMYTSGEVRYVRRVEDLPDELR